MAEITAALVKELRERTGAGMMDCKRALGEADGDIEVATDWLRKKGLAAAAKKAGRSPAEGLIGIALTARRCAGRGQRRDRLRCPQRELPGAGAADRGPGARGEGRSRGAEGGRDRGHRPDGRGEITQAIAVIGENINLRRTAYLEVEQGVVAGYLHNQLARASASWACWWRCSHGRARRALAEIGKQLAMHVAATSPQAVTAEPRPCRDRARAGDLRRPGPRVGQARQHHREDGRGPDAQVPRGSRAARAGVRGRHRQAREGGGRRPPPRSWCSGGGRGFVRMVLARASTRAATISLPRWRSSPASEQRPTPAHQRPAGEPSAMSGQRRAGARFRRVLLKMSGEALLGDARVRPRPRGAAPARRRLRRGPRAWASSSAS